MPRSRTNRRVEIAGLRHFAEALADRRSLRRGDPDARALDRREEAIAAERLQQVVDRRELEGADGVLIVGRGEDHRRRPRLGLAQHVEPRQARQADVEAHQRRPRRRDHPDRPFAVPGLADDREPTVGLEEVPQLLPRERLVVDNDDGDRTHARESTDSQGSVTVTANLVPVATTTLARSGGYLSARRSRSR